MIAVVRRVEERLRFRVEGEGRHEEPERALDLRDLLHLPVVHRDRADVRDDARVIEGGVELPRDGVPEGPRDAAEGVRREVLVRRRRVRPDRGEVLLLELLLEGDPLVPRVGDRLPEDAPELRGVVGLRPLPAPEPLDELLRRVAVREERHEPLAVDVRVRLELEVDLRPFRDEAERRVEAAPVPHHRAEDHLVPGTLAPAPAPGHPRLEEDRGPFVVPARGQAARRRQVVVEDRLRLLRRRRDLPREHGAPEPIARPRVVVERHVDELVVHHPVDRLVRRDGLVGEGHGRDLEHHEVPGDDVHAGVAEVGEVVQEDRDLLGRPVREDPPVEAEGVLERAGDVRDEVRLPRREVDEPQVVGLERRDLAPGRRRPEKQGGRHDGGREPFRVSAAGRGR